MEQKDNTGAIFKNDYKEKELAMWLNESKNGKKYFSVKFSEPYQAEVEAGYGHKPKEDKNDLPF